MSMTTETRNERTDELDAMSPAEILAVMNDEDARVPEAIRGALPQIEAAVRCVSESLRRGGRLIYIGAGTSGRLGVLDAVECVPTFGVAPNRVIGLIAGGPGAMMQAVEGAEDSPDLGAGDLRAVALSEKDTVVGIAASGRTPYVLGALKYARSVGAQTVSLSCNREAPISAFADVSIEISPGPEVLTGSTRLKAGSVQKMVLNMISTASMVAWGKVYRNLMVDVRATNEKLRGRAENIVMTAAGVGREAARQALSQSDGACKPAIVSLLLNCSVEEARAALSAAEGRIRTAVRDRFAPPPIPGEPRAP